MKKIIALLFFIVTSSVFAQNSGITYQAVIYNPSTEILPGNNNPNVVLAAKDICLRFSITDANSSLEYQEIQKVKTDEFGMVNLIVGDGDQVNGYAADFDAVIWNSTNKNLKVEIDASGNCTNFIEISNQKFSSVPFAYASKTAESISGIVPIVNGGTGSSTVSGAKSNLGLNNVDNTSDLNKPVSTATQIALDTKASLASPGFTGLPTAPTAIAGTNTTQIATTAFVNAALATAASPDATATQKGRIQLAGDLGGTADMPTVIGLANKEDVSNKSIDMLADAQSTIKYPSVKLIKDYVDTQISSGGVGVATTIEKGIVKLSGDLEGTADSPTITNSAVIGKVLTGFTPTSGTVMATDNILQAIQKVDGNVGLKANINSPTFTGTVSGIDKTMVGLGDVDNTSDADKPVSTATQTALNAKENTIDAGTTSQYWRGDKTWQTLDNSVVGLSNVDNTSDANKPVSTATQTALNAKESTIASGTTSQYYRGDKSWQTLDKSVVGLGNVDNTSDADKPVSTATQTALNAKESTIASGTTSQYYRGDKTWQTLDKSVVGLGNVDNTADEDKPISTAVQTALDAKENAVNKSDVTTLGTSDVLFPTQNAVKTYVDTQITANTTPDATDSIKGKIQLGGDLAGTGSSAASPVITNNAISTNKIANDAVTTVKIAPGSTNSVLVTDGTGAVDWLDQGAFGAKADDSTIEGVGTTANPFKVKDLGIITDKLANGSVTTVKLADDAVTNAKIGETISVENGGTGATSLTGYLKGNGTAAFTSVSTIPVADVTGAVRKVNGVVPDANGNVAVIIGRVFTGATLDPDMATSIINASPAKQQSDIYIIADGTNPNNGRTFIYDGTNWLEVATDLSTSDARYVNVAGDEMEGDLTVPTGVKITIVDAPTGDTDATNKLYVDTKVANAATPDATDLIKGKIKLTNHLGGTADAPTVPGLALKAPLESPSLTGTPLAPTAAAGTNTTQIATTAFVTAATSGKQDAITLTTTGTGVASLTGSTLNIPTPNNGTVTEVSALTIGTSGTDITSTVATSTTTPVVTLNVPTASAANRGALSAADWTTFNDKVGGSGTTNFVPKFNSSNEIEDSTIFDDGSNVGIGTSSPANRLEIKQGTTGNSGLRFTNLTSSNNATTASNKVLGVNNNGDVILTNIPGTQNIVAFSTATPTTSGVVFTPNTPSDQSVIYQSSTDNSLWTYNGTTYVTYTPPATTAWNLAGTSNDAGGNKITAIERTGSASITNGFLRAIGNGNAFTVDPTEGTGPRLKLGTTGAPNSYFELGAYNSINNFDTKARDFNIFSTAAANILYLRNATGRVGINTSTPLGRFVVDDKSYISALPLSVSNLSDNSTFRPHTRFQNTVGADNNGLSIYSTTAAWAMQSHNYTTGALLPLIFQPAGGNVGVGITAPSARFHANTPSGTNNVARFTTEGTGTNWANIGLGNNSGVWSSIASGDSKFQIRNFTNDTSILHADLVSGNVGVGTTTPATRLHVNSNLPATNTINADGQVFRMMRPQAGGIKWENIAQFNLGSYAATTGNTFATSRLDLAMNDGDGVATNNVMTWQANGNVGIGITNPLHRLSIVSDTQDAGRFVSSNTGFTGIILGNSSTANVFTRLAAGANSFQIQNVSTNAAVLHADLSTTNIGIGTTTPTAQFEIATNNGLSALIRRGGTAFQSPANLILQKTSGANAATHGAVVNGDYVGRILFSASNGSSYLTNGTDIVGYAAGNQTTTNNGGGIFFRTVPQNSVAQSVERMRIDDAGRVGIGTSSPTAQLHTTGSVLLAGAGTPGAGKVLTSDASGNATWQNAVGSTTVSNKTANFTLTASDNAGFIVVNSASLITVTVPATLAAGFYCQIIQQGAGQVQVIGSGVTMNSALGFFTRAQGSSIGIMMATGTIGFVSGDTGL